MKIKNRRSKMNWNSKSGPEPLLKRSMSTIDLSVVKTDVCLREARSFSGAFEQCRYADSGTETDGCQLDQIGNFRKLYGKDQATEAKGFVTREVSSNQIFLVKDEMLTYRGKRYSFTDIAIRWKKDCRMWLWKSKIQRKNKSLSELREKVQNAKLAG